MIANFFQSLEAHRVAYLLISGQATILYGAATFSEDVDLWVEPSPENVERFRNAIRQTGARYYKLTPPLKEKYLNAGHGFHFTFGEASETVFLDIMGQPPRTHKFESAHRAACEFDTEWGKLPVISMRDLVEVKKTQRLADYPIVSTLTLRALESAAVSAETLKWAAANLFTVESFFSFNERYPQWIQSPPQDAPVALTQFAGRQAEEVPEPVVEEAARWMSAAMARYQLADRNYWRPIVAELRQLSRDGLLMSEGAAV